MNKLSKTLQASKGFALVELLVVISIIAVLAVVALSVFSNVQKSARDSRRRSEIDALAKSIETTRNPVSQLYVYTTTSYANDFANPLKDPKSGGVTHYCILTSATPTDPNTIGSAAPTWSTSDICPTAPGSWTDIDAAGSGFSIGTSSNIGSWKVCGQLEIDGSSFCKSSLIR